MKKIIGLYVFILIMHLNGYTQDLVSSDKITAVENALTGFSTDISGNWTIVGSPQRDVNGKQSMGGATFYKLTNGEWKIFQEVLPQDLSDLANFGMHVSIDKNIAVISAIGDHQGGMFSGAAYVYEYDYTQNEWVLEVKLKASDLGVGKRFGHSVEIKDNLIVIGSYNADGAEEKSGAIYIYQKTGDNWSFTQKAFPSTGKSDDFFGHQVHILNENQIAIGAYNADGAEERTGVVYIFQKQSNTWQEQVQLSDDQGISGDLFGYSLTSGVSNTGESTLFVGAPGTNNSDLQTGSVYSFVETNTGWLLSSELIESTSEHNDHFGVSVSFNERGFLFVGANRASSESNKGSGKVYIYQNVDINAGSNQTGNEFANTSVTSFDHFGTSVTADKENVIISAPYATEDSLARSGTVYFYRYSSIINENDESLYLLKQNSPNPSNGITTIEYQLKKAGNVKLDIFDINGNLISNLVNEFQDFGLYTIPVDVSKLSSGVYIYKIEINEFTESKKMIIGN